MISRIKRSGFVRRCGPRLMAAAAAILMFALASCNVSDEGGHAYMNIAKDPSWDAYDTLEISWRDSAGKEGILFRDAPGKLQSANKLLAEGYQGQKITLTFKGFLGDSLVSDVRQSFDPAFPALLKRDTVLAFHPRKDKPTADAGPDQSVFTGDTVKLDGIGKDGSGHIVRKEWKIGADAFAESSGPWTFKAPAEPGDVAAVFRVTDDSGRADTDTATIHVLARNKPALTDLQVSAGRLSPRFDPADTLYADTLPYASGPFTVTPVGNGTITVKGSAVVSGKASAELKLDVGANPVPIVVSLPGVPDKTYLLTVVRLPASGGSTLSGLFIPPGKLDQTFSPQLNDYTASVAQADSSLKVIATLADTTASLAVNNAPARSGAEVAIRLDVGINTIPIVVTAQDGSKNTYTLQVTRAGNGNADLANLTLSAGALKPAFSPETLTYSLWVANSATSTTVTPKVAVGTSKVKVKNTDVPSGSASLPINLALGFNAIAVTVTAENGTAKTYTVYVTRQYPHKLIATGLGHTLFIKSDGSLWATGTNASGELGDSAIVGKIATPKRIMSGSSFIEVATGMSHTLMLKSDGSLWAAGDNSYGQLGDGTTTKRRTPVHIMAGSSFVQIAAGHSHSLMLKSDGTLWGMGDNAYGQLGDSAIKGQSPFPIQIMAGSFFTQIACGEDHSLMIRSDGTAWAMGNNVSGQLGDGTTIDKSTPVQVMPGSAFSLIAAGREFSLLIRTDGSLWAMGDNSVGQLGDKTIATRRVPVHSLEGSAFTWITAGSNHSLLVKSDGTVMGAGDNSFGQFGDGTTTNTVPPRQILAGSTYTQVIAGDVRSFFIKTDGTYWGTGNNTFGELGDGTTTNRTLPVKILP